MKTVEINLNKQEKIEIVETALSWIVTMAMLIYGSAKYIQLDRTAYLDKKISELTSMEIMWSFYGTSPNYAIALGILEVSGAILIFFKRTRIIGCLLTTTILLNIILQDIFYDVFLGALTGAIFYQFLILFILWFNRERIVKAFKLLMLPALKYQPKKKKYITFIIAFLLFLVIRMFEYFLTIKLFQ